MVFDAVVENTTFEERLELLTRIGLPSFVHRVEHVLCKSKDHFLVRKYMCFFFLSDFTNKDFFKKVQQENGEGIILREGGSFYEHKRSPSLRKFKVLRIGIFRRIFQLKK